MEVKTISMFDMLCTWHPHCECELTTVTLWHWAQLYPFLFVISLKDEHWWRQAQTPTFLAQKQSGRMYKRGSQGYTTSLEDRKKLQFSTTNTA